MTGNAQVPFPYPFDPSILTGSSVVIGQVVADFNSAVNQGFELKDGVGEDLLRVINNMIDATQNIIDNSWLIAQEPKLGDTPAALVYRPFLATIASDKVHGFLPAMQRLIAGLEKLRTDIKQAINTYHNAEVSIIDEMNRPR